MLKQPIPLKMVYELAELCKKSTQVVGWYPHPFDGNGQIRGPYHRWFILQSGDDSWQKVLSDPKDDIAFAAAAMNSLPHLIEEILKLKEALRYYVDFFDNGQVARDALGIE